jgi:hypothetical protein
VRHLPLRPHGQGKRSELPALPSVFIDPLPEGKFEVISVFPLMQPDQWCGQWAARVLPTSG